MEKDDVVLSLNEIADLLELVEASQFEYMAYRNAASALKDWTGDLAESVEARRVTDIPAIGKGTAECITELVQTDSSNILDNVRSQIPEELPKLLRFRGLGPKRVRLLWKELDIDSPHNLSMAIEDGRVATLKGFGAKTIESMQASIDYFQNNNIVTQETSVITVLPQPIKSTGKICAGTSGYSYPKWKGNFFPVNAKTSEFLNLYSKKLPTVEINNTFYRFPSEKVIAQWKSEPVGNFLFALKAHRRVTHQMRLNKGTKDRIREFVERCAILGDKLGCILFQLPPDFERDDERLGNLLSALPQGPRYAIEFRHNSWFDEQVYDRLKFKNIACVSGDSEKKKPRQLITADFVYVRLRKPAYKKSELDKWVQWFAEQQSANRDVLVYLKHDDTGDAPTAAMERWHSN